MDVTKFRLNKNHFLIMDEVKKLLHEHQRQLTQLFELYERSKSHNDTRAYILNQGLTQYSEQLNSLQKEARATFRAFDHLHTAVKHCGFREMHLELKSLHEEIAKLKKLQEDTNKQIFQQNLYVKDLENVLRRTYILADNQQLLAQGVSESSEQLQDIFRSCEQHLFPLGTPVLSEECPAPMSPLSLPESMV